MQTKPELQTNSSIYVELDALMDTRLSILYELSRETALRYLVDGFGDRARDEFVADGKGVDFSTFKKAYDARDKAALQNASVTLVLDMVQSYVLTTLKTTANSPIKVRPRVWLNTYPYDLADAEKQIIAAALHRATDSAADINFMFADFKNTTPTFFKEEISIAIMYRPDLWLDEHCGTEEILKNSCPTVSLYGPRMSFVDRPEPATDEDFDTYVQAAQPFINLMLLPPKYFGSVLVGKFKVKK